MTPFTWRPICAWMSALCIFATGTALAAPAGIQLPPETVKLKMSRLPGYAVAQQKCAICHSADYIAYQPPGMTLTQWTAEVTKMQRMYGAPIDDNEVKLLGIYLAATYGDASSVSAADRALTASQQSAKTAAVPAAVAAVARPASTGVEASKAIDVQALLRANACLGCHAVTQKIVGPAFQDVAAKYRQDSNALSRLEASIKAGGAGKWGPAAMPPFANLTQEQLKALAGFVMKQ
jgi:cytochrome c551/c552